MGMGRRAKGNRSDERIAGAKKRQAMFVRKWIHR